MRTIHCILEVKRMLQCMLFHADSINCASHLFFLIGLIYWGRPSRSLLTCTKALTWHNDALSFSEHVQHQDNVWPHCRMDTWAGSGNQILKPVTTVGLNMNTLQNFVKKRPKRQAHIRIPCVHVTLTSFGIYPLLFSWKLWPWDSKLRCSWDWLGTAKIAVFNP